MQYNIQVLKFFESHLTDILNDINAKTFELIFNIEVPQFVVDELEPFGFVEHRSNILKFINLYNIANEDVGKTIEEVDRALMTENKNIIPIKDNYEKIVKELLNVNNIYSSFLEIILCNLYVNEEDVIYRYQQSQHKSIDKKYSVYHVSTMISPLLAMLYTPNNITMNNLNLDLTKSIDKLSILEKIWMQTK